MRPEPHVTPSAHVPASFAQRTTQLEAPSHVAVQSPSHVRSHSPVPWHWSEPAAPTSAVQPLVPGQTTWHEAPHVRLQLALPSHSRVAPLESPPISQVVPP